MVQVLAFCGGQDYLDLPYSQIKVTNSKNKTIAKLADFNGEFLIQAVVSIYTLEINHNLYRYQDAIKLKNANRIELFLQFDYRTKNQ